ncbi:MAG: tyrosine-type recombinase/integrase [Bryobacterales bacterium]|nr:tyrosine-type recombinase/integrase [Bryobacterales bacterium]
MTLRAATDRYLAWKRSRGEDCRTVGSILLRYSRSAGEALGSGDATSAHVLAFLADAPSATQRAVRHSTLNCFYRYAIRHRLADSSPLPARSPQVPAAAPAYIYTPDDMRRLLDEIPSQTKPACRMASLTFRTLLLVLYGTGLRRSEALGLKMRDVDTGNALLTVRNAKFSKTRLVPLGPDLVRVVTDHVGWAGRCAKGNSDDPHLFTSRDGAPLRPDTVTHAFGRLRRAAGVRRNDGAYFQPRLHDFRHTFAVRRLTSWYREGADVQRLLPCLSTYLGHSSIAATQVYLTMTPELLEEAAGRFERFVTAAPDTDA